MPSQTSSIDTAALLASVDLLSLVANDTELRRVSGTRGGEYAGPCPFCGGRDRFRVQPEQQRWWCRTCSPDEHWSDAISYVMRRDNLDFVAACRALGARDGYQPAPFLPRRASASAVRSQPSEVWCQAAEAFVTACEAALWSDRGAPVRQWLTEQRGLTVLAIRRWRLGWNGEDLRRPRGRWGLAPDRNRAVWHPLGLVIPWSLDGLISAIKVRRPQGEPRFVAVEGSCPVLFGAETLADHQTAVLVESELDAILVEQEAGDLVAVVAAGSARASLDDRARSLLLGQSRVLVGYDNDVPGDLSADRLVTTSLRMRRHRPVVGQGKDPGEFYRQGGRIRDWVAMGLARHVALPSVDRTTIKPDLAVVAAPGPDCVPWGGPEPAGHCLDCGRPSPRSRTLCDLCAGPLARVAGDPDAGLMSATPLPCTACGQQPLPATRKYTCATCVPQLRSASGKLASAPWESGAGTEQKGEHP